MACELVIGCSSAGLESGVGTEGRQELENTWGGFLVPGEDGSFEVAAEAHSPSGKPQWSRHTVLGAHHSCALMEI